MRQTISQCLFALFASLTLLLWMYGESQGFNRYAHVELFERALTHLRDSGHSEMHRFYTGENPDTVDVRFLADDEDEIMWADVHSTTEPDGDAAHFLIDISYPYCWDESLPELLDPEDIESCRDCIRQVVNQFPSIALPRAGQETVYFPSRGSERSMYDFCWEIPLSFIIGLVDSTCDALGYKYGVSGANSLRAETQVHTAKFKSLEYLNYAVRAWNDGDCESALRWLVRIFNYDPHHSMTAFKTYDYLTESWVSEDMDGDLDVDYDDSEIWNRNLLDYGIYYLLFCTIADGSIPPVVPESVSIETTSMLDWHSEKMNERASYSAALWPMVDEFNDYFNGNAQGAVDELLPGILRSGAALLANFYHNVVAGEHPEFLIVCVEGIPREKECIIEYSLDYGDWARIGTDSLPGYYYTYYEIPRSARIQARSHIDSDTVLGYRFDRMVVCDGYSKYESEEPTLTVSRGTTVHLIYTPYWDNIDQVARESGQSKNQQVSHAKMIAPGTFSLSQNFPNPASGFTTIEYTIPVKCHVSLDLYNMSGRKVITLLSRHHPPGCWKVNVRTGPLPSGTYFYRLTAGELCARRKLILLN